MESVNVVLELEQRLAATQDALKQSVALCAEQATMISNLQELLNKAIAAANEALALVDKR